jgi:hypothetical protein
MSGSAPKIAARLRHHIRQRRRQDRECALPMPSSSPATGSTDTWQHQRLADLLRNAKPPGERGHQ